MQKAGRKTSVDKARKEGIAVDEENDFLNMVNSEDWDPDKYRVWFLDACTSIAYLDEIRSFAGGPENIDVVATRKPPGFLGTIDEQGQMARAIMFLEGVLGMRTIEEIVDLLELDQRGTEDKQHSKKGVWATEGFGGNPTNP